MIGKVVDITGNRYGRLIVVSHSHKGNRRQSYWHCKCDCGEETIKSGESLKRGDTKSCGCFLLENAKKGNRRTHNLSKTKIYKIWASMLQRCNNPNNKQFKNYGGRGIKVCKRWHSFKKFYTDMGERPPERSLDRIDNNKGYNKKNCRWATQAEQSRNTRSNLFIQYKGEIKTASDWSMLLGIPKTTISLRYKRGVSIDSVLSTTHLLKNQSLNKGKS